MTWPSGIDRRAMQVLTRTETIATAVQDWLARFETALGAGDRGLLASLFVADSYWRDVLALTWRIGTIAGAGAIVDELPAHAARARPTAFELASGRAPPRRVTRAGTQAIEAIFRFETAQGRGSGVVRLVDDDGAPKAWTLLTALDEIKGHEERLGRTRPSGETYSRDFRGPNWLDASPRSGYEISLKLFGTWLEPMQRRFAVAETLSHLERLTREERARRGSTGGTVTYTAP